MKKSPKNRLELSLNECLNAQEIKQEIKDSEYLQGELFITYKIIETNQFRTLNFTFDYMLSKHDVE